MTIIFFVARIVIIPVYWFKVYYILIRPLDTSTIDDIEIAMNKYLYIMIVTCIVLDIINIYWFIKIFKGAILVTLGYFKLSREPNLSINDISTIDKNN